MRKPIRVRPINRTPRVGARCFPCFSAVFLQYLARLPEHIYNGASLSHHLRKNFCLSVKYFTLPTDFLNDAPSGWADLALIWRMPDRVDYSVRPREGREKHGVNVGCRYARRLTPGIPQRYQASGGNHGFRTED
jgi:hypothetical protein